MKKLLYILVFIVFGSCSFAQTWAFEYDFSEGDTIIQPYGIANVTGLSFTLTFDISQIDSVFSFDLGGSLFEENPVIHRYRYFQGAYRSLPYAVYPEIMDSVISFTGDRYPYNQPMIKFNTLTNDTGVINCIMKFY